jgi:aryl-alcohol dehydrogenase-like predicted oxidoreductase
VRFRAFAPLGRDLSVLVLGTAFLTSEEPAPAFELLDAWLAAGGNVLDTAREYGEPHGAGAKRWSAAGSPSGGFAIASS